MKVKFFCLTLLFMMRGAIAEIPEAYKPMVITAPFSLSERVFNLTPAFEKAKQLNKPVLVYFGAADCPPCKDYGVFLNKSQVELMPAFSNYVVVDVRTWLRGSKLLFQINDQKYSTAEFKERIGDTNKTLTYPTWWLLNADGKQLKQMPQGTTSYTDIASHIRLLKIS